MFVMVMDSFQIFLLNLSFVCQRQKIVSSVVKSNHSLRISDSTLGRYPLLVYPSLHCLTFVRAMALSVRLFGRCMHSERDADLSYCVVIS